MFFHKKILLQQIQKEYYLQDNPCNHVFMLLPLFQEILFQNRKLRIVTEFACLLTVSATDSTVSAMESTVLAMKFDCFSNGRLFQHST